MENAIVRHRWWIIGGSFGFLILTIILYGLNFHFRGPSQNTEDWGVFGDFLSGFLGTIFGFVTIALLVFFEHDRSREADHKEDLDFINTSVLQNRQIFNSISLYVRDDSNINRGGAGSNTVSMLKKSGPESFFELYKNDFIAEYLKYLRVYISMNTPTFINSLSDNCANIFVLNYSTKHPGVYRQVYAHPTTTIQETLNRFCNTLPLQDQFEFSLSGLEERVVHAIKDSALNLDPNLIKTIVDNAFNDFFLKRGHIYGHYIRNQFYVFDSIQSSGLSNMEKSKLFKSYRSHLSGYELVIMFYNCLSSKSKPAYNDHIFLNEMFDDLEIVNFIHASFFQKYKYSLMNISKKE